MDSCLGCLQYFLLQTVLFIVCIFVTEPNGYISWECKGQPRNERVEKDLLPQQMKAWKLVPKQCHPEQRQCEVLLADTIHMHSDKHFKGGHILEHAQFMIVIQGKMAGLLNSKSWSTCLKG
jgi:hypothetical protein